MTNLLAKRILLGLGDGVVVVERLLERLGRDTHLLREVGTRLKALHQATTAVVLAVPLDLLRRASVENKANGVLKGG